MTFRTLGLGMILLGGCSAADGVDAPQETGTDTQEDQFYYEDAWVWGSSTISVCWKTSGSSTEKLWVRNIIESTYEPLFNIDFTGWGSCGSANIVIQVADNLWPQTTAKAHTTPSSSANMNFNFFLNTPVDTNDADSGIDFANCYNRTTNYTGVTGRSWTSERRRCIEATAVHEFGHHLGIDHEQDRADNPAGCGGAGPGTFTAYGYYDVTSISNYCNPAWNGDGYLSPLDVAGLGALYGSKVNDVVWYGLGNAADYGGAPLNQTMYDIRAVSNVGGTYVPLIADFDGDTNDDVLWYAQSGSDYVWFANFNRTWDDSIAISQVTGTYKPVAGDFDGNGNGDVYWHAANGNDHVWWGQDNGTFVNTDVWFGLFSDPSQIPIAGDFDNNGVTDIFFYSTAIVEVILWGETSGVFTVGGSADNVTGTYKPFTGDFDGDGRSDIFWYAPGSAVDRIWWGNANRTFSSVSTEVTGTYDVTVGDFDGSGTSDIFWSGSGSNDGLWLYNTTRGSRTSTKIIGHGSAKPFSGDFDDDGISDIFWYTPG